MENLDTLIKEIEDGFVERVGKILGTDLSKGVKMKKIGSEFEKCNSDIDDLVVNYQIDFHDDELPF